MTEDQRHFENFIASIEFDDIPEVKHRDRLEQGLRTALAQRPRSKRRSNAWSMVVRSRTTKLVAAVVIAAGIMASVFLMDKTVAPAYAVEQTLDAIKEVQTVHMAGEFYRQGKFECWLRFDGDPDVPTHMCLCLRRIRVCKVCSPAGLFHLNKRTNCIFFIGLDHRRINWAIRFGSFFRHAVEAASEKDSVTISSEKGFIAVYINRLKREQKVLVDAHTQLPVSFSTTWEGAPMEMLKRKTLTIKNLEWIRYNQEPPDGIFDIPANAKVVQNDFDCWVDPNSGLVVDGMPRHQACLAIVKQTGQAMVDLDIDALCKLDLNFLGFSPEMWEQVRQMKEAGQWVDEFTITGDAFQEDDIWHVPFEYTRLIDGKKEVDTALIKFYNLEGKTLCVIVGSKKDGFVD